MRVGLTTARLVTAGAELADEVGFAHVTVSALARRFDVKVASLYAHVASSPRTCRTSDPTAAGRRREGNDGGTSGASGTSGTSGSLPTWVDRSEDRCAAAPRGCCAQFRTV
jgi:hypothetical protein